MRTSEQIKAEIQERFGFVPPFFDPAQENPEVLEYLWQQTLFAYVGNPLSPLFKEKLSAYLSRYCAVPYCMICHSCSLHDLGMNAREVLELLESSPPTPKHIDKHLSVLAAMPGELTVLPEPNSALEETLLYCSVYIFQEGDEAQHIRTEMRRVLGPLNYQHLVTFVAYVKSCHVWMEAHPEVAYEADRRVIDHLGALCKEEPGLAEFFRNYRQRVRRECQSRGEQLAEIAERKRNEAALRHSEERLRLALEAASMGTWDWDILSGRVTWSDNLELLFGLAPGRFGGTYEAFLGCVHPEDRQMVDRAVARAVEEKADYEIEFRVVWPDSTVHWVAIKGQVYYDKTGKAVRMTGVGMDITDRKRLEAIALSKQKELADFFENGNIGLHWVGADGKILWANQAELDLLGYTREEYIGQPIAGFHADKEVIEDILQRLTAKQTLHNYEARLLCKDGSIRHVLINSNVFWKDDQFIHTRCFTRDITQRKQAQEALRESEARLKLALEASRTGIWDWNIQTGRVTCSDNIDLLFGIVFGETYEAFLECVHPEDRFFVAASVTKAVDERAEHDVEFRVIWPDGSVRWMAGLGQVFCDQTGKAVRMLGTVRDITKRKRVEQERDRFFNLSLDMLCIAGLDGYFKRLNPAWERSILYTTEELVSTSFLDFVHPEDRAKTIAELENLARGTSSLDFENRYCCKDGSYKWLAWKAFPDVEAGLVYAIARDVTERKQAESERLRLIEQEQAARNRITNILESITDAFFALDNEWRFTYLNKQAERLLHRTRSELRGANLWDEFPDAVASVFFEQYHKAVSQQVSVEFEAFYPPLNVWFQVHAYPSRDGVSVYFQDINERKRAQGELQRQNLRSQLFSEIALKIRQSLQLEEILQTTVTEVQKILQADRVLIFRHWPHGFGKVITEAVVPECLPILGQTFPKEVFPEEFRQLYCQGRICAIADLENNVDVPTCLVEFLHQFGVKAKLVVPIIQKQDLWGLLIAHQCNRTRQWQNFEVELLQQLATQVGIALAQAQLLEEETRQRQELAAYNAELQQFAYVASHDLQEPLRKIQAFGDRLKAKFSSELTDQGRDYIERMQNAAGRMQALIDDLLTFSRVTSKAQPFAHVSLAQVIQEVLSDLEVRIHQTGGRVEVGELPTIDADPIQMRQLLQNLVSNALKFHHRGEPPVISIRSQLLQNTEQPTEGYSATVETRNFGPLHCQIIVQDNGIGFEMKYLDRIFNVFQRLHGRCEYEGTGMGLAICRKIAERHGGSITATSTPGQGATFIVTLPVKQNKGEKLE